ncbi:MAG: barstar family protein [Candidatus Limnocylindrales bacterium]
MARTEGRNGWLRAATDPPGTRATTTTRSRYPASPEDAYELAWALQSAGTIARVIRGSKMTTLDGFFDEIGAALQLPAYFGENWPALHECLTDMQWLRGPAYVLIVTDGDLLFSKDESDSLPTFLNLATAAGERWAAPTDLDKPWGHGRVPFHVVFQVRVGARVQWSQRLAASGHEAPSVDLKVAG